MRLLLLAALTLPAFGQQIGLTMKPWPASDPKDLLGLRKHLVWDLSVTCPPGMPSFRRQDIAALISVSELNYTASIDVLEKALKLDSRGLLAKAGKIGLKAGEVAMVAGGAATGNVPLVLAGVGLAIGEGATNVLESVKPETLRYVPALLPDNSVEIPCKDGRGGMFLVLTGKVKDPPTIRVEATHREIRQVQPASNSVSLKWNIFWNNSRSEITKTEDLPTGQYVTEAEKTGAARVEHFSDWSGSLFSPPTATHPAIYETPQERELSLARAAMEANPSPETERAWREKLKAIGAGQ